MIHHETLAIRCDDIGTQCRDICARCRRGDIGARCRVSGDIGAEFLVTVGITPSGDCGVGITPQMCNRVTNHGEMGTFSKPVVNVLELVQLCISYMPVNIELAKFV